MVWTECIIKGCIQSEIIHYYRTTKTYIRYKILDKWNWGFPKGPKSHGNGSGIVVKPSIYTLRNTNNLKVMYEVNNKVQKRNYCSKTSAATGGGSSLEQILIFDNNNKCVNAYDTLMSINILLASYQAMKSKPGKITPGSDKETLDGIDMNYFKNLNVALKTEKFQCRPTRRIFIPKANGKMRPLGISSPRDKIVQQAINLILTQVLEPRFSDRSHGFRPGRGCHTALAKIRYWNGIK